MDLSLAPPYTPSTELQRRAVEAQRNDRRLDRYYRLYTQQIIPARALAAELIRRAARGR
jgi:hypothetical protein